MILLLSREVEGYGPMKPRQPGIETAKMLLEAPRVPTPADKFWKMRGSPVVLSAGSQARDPML